MGGLLRGRAPCFVRGGSWVVRDNRSCFVDRLWIVAFQEDSCS